MIKPDVRDVTERESARFIEVSIPNYGVSFFKLQGENVTRLNSMGSKSPVAFANNNSLTRTQIENMIATLQSIIKLM